MKHAIIAAVAALALAGCGSTAGDAPAATPSPQGTPGKQSAEPADEAQGIVIDVTIKDGEVRPANKRIDAKVGQKITLNVSSDAPDELHVHSEPEHSFEVKAASDQLFTFAVEVPGQVAVELHHLEAAPVQLVVRP